MRKHAACQRSSVNDRIAMLTQKLSTTNLNSASNSNKKYTQIQNSCQQLQNQLNQYRTFMQAKLVDIKHKTGKINKEINKDYQSIDMMVRNQIQKTNERMMTLIDQQYDGQRDKNLRLFQYIQQETQSVKLQIQRQNIQRQQTSRQISQSLQSDIAHIRQTLEECSLQNDNRLSILSNGLLSHSSRLSQQFNQICQTYSDNQAQFYKMLRDLVKKVKQELSQHQHKRQQTQIKILELIDKICDKSISAQKQQISPNNSSNSNNIPKNTINDYNINL